MLLNIPYCFVFSVIEISNEFFIQIIEATIITTHKIATTIINCSYSGEMLKGFICVLIKFIKI